MVRADRRLFFALWPPDETRAALADACRPALRACDGRTVPPSRYHVTLAFIGSSREPDERFDRFAQLALVRPPEFETPDIELILDRFGYWRRPRVLWIGPRECPAGLAMLAARIRSELDVLGIGYDGQDFRPHLTLARKVTSLPELCAPSPVHWPVRSFVLAESLSTPDGPAYEVLRRFSLGPSTGRAFPAGSRHDPNQE